MSGNTFGKLFTVTTFGESHGAALGCIIDGCPPGLELSEADMQKDLDLRKPGTSRHTTQRREPDEVRILAGVFEGKTTGTPIGLIIRTPISDPRTIPGFPNSSARPTPITPTPTNTVCGIIAAAAVPRPGKPPCGWLPEPLRANSWSSAWVFAFGATCPSLAPSRSRNWTGVRYTRTRSSARTPTRCRKWKPTWTRCVKRAIPLVLASTWWPKGFRPGWVSRFLTGWMPTWPTP